MARLHSKLLLLAVAALNGCAIDAAIKNRDDTGFESPVVEASRFYSRPENQLRPPDGGRIPVAVYGFSDRTGQRKSTVNVASLSSAVTQGADSYLIKALQEVGNGDWFTVLERVGLENLIKERQLIRQSREQYQGRDAKPLPSMLFAGVVLEGGIIGYDSNTITGGSGIRFLGIGAQTQYQSDTVTINLRSVSVATGEVLTNVTVTKTVLSYVDKYGVLRFMRDGTSAFEAETGSSINESINRAVNVAIQAAVIDTVRQGVVRGHWHYQTSKGN